MAFTRPAFCPGEGWNDPDTFPTRPYSEEETRRLLNLLHNELRDYLKDTLLPELEDAGASSIGSPPLPGVEGTANKNVWQLLCFLYSQIQYAAAGAVPDGSITDAKLSHDAASLISRTARHAEDLILHCPTVSTGGSAAAFTAQTGAELSALSYGMQILLIPHTDCTALPTLALDGLPPVALLFHDGNPIPAGTLRAGRPYRFVFNGSAFLAELALQKAERVDPTLEGDVCIGEGGSLTVASADAGALYARNIAILGENDDIPALAEGDVVLIVEE